MEFKIKKPGDEIVVVLNDDGGWCRSNLVHYKGILVDTGPDPVICTENMNALKKESGSLKVDTVVITHPDIDHVGGLKLFPDAKLIMAENAVKAYDDLKPKLLSMLVDKSFLFFGTGKYYKQSMKGFDFASIELRSPDEIFNDEKRLDTGGKDVVLKNFSYCHSHSDTIVILPDNVVAAGDLLFNGVTPIVWGYPGNWLKALDHIISLKPEWIIPGHGDLMKLADVMFMKRYLEFLKEQTRFFYEKRHKVGNAVREICKVMPDEFKKLLLPERIAVNVEAFYAEFGGSPAPADYPVMKKLRLFGKMKKAIRFF